jgi:hypothetical protein
MADNPEGEMTPCAWDEGHKKSDRIVSPLGSQTEVLKLCHLLSSTDNSIIHHKSAMNKQKDHRFNKLIHDRGMVYEPAISLEMTPSGRQAPEESA